MAEVVGSTSPSPEVRVAAWFRGERPNLSYRPLSTWGPVLYSGGASVEREAES